jgi:hypothetical protein
VLQLLLLLFVCLYVCMYVCMYVGREELVATVPWLLLYRCKSNIVCKVKKILSLFHTSNNK